MAKKSDITEMARTLVSLYQLSQNIKDIPEVIDELIITHLGISQADYDALDISHQPYTYSRTPRICRIVQSRRRVQTTYEVQSEDDMRKCLEGSIRATKKQYDEMVAHRDATKLRKARESKVKQYITNLNLMGTIGNVYTDGGDVTIGDFKLYVRCAWSEGYKEITGAFVKMQLSSNQVWLPINTAMALFAQYFVTQEEEVA